MESSNIESGLQFLARIKPRSTLENFDRVLFPNGLLKNETIELCGNLSSGKSLLLTQLIAKCITPQNYEEKNIGGLGARVVLINTNYHLIISKLKSFIINSLYKNKFPDLNPGIIDSIIRRSFNNLVIINCYNSLQFSLTIQTLDNILLNNRDVSLIAIDSIAAYYWEDRRNGGNWMMSRYVTDILKRVQKHTSQWNIPFIYTVINDCNNIDKNKILCVEQSTIGKINYRLKLCRDENTKKCICTVESHSQSNQINYTIDSNGIVWNRDEN